MRMHEDMSSSVDQRGEYSATAVADRSPMLEISNAMVRLYKEAFGRGPTKARAQFAGPDTLIVILESSLTVAERNLVALGEHQRLRERRGRADPVGDIFATRAVVGFDPHRPALRRQAGPLARDHVADAGSTVVEIGVNDRICRRFVLMPGNACSGLDADGVKPVGGFLRNIQIVFIARDLVGLQIGPADAGGTFFKTCRQDRVITALWIQG